MPHVSRKKLKPETADKIFKKLVKVLENAQSKNRLSDVLSELLTETEKIMLAKRLAVILLILSDIPEERISEALIMSPTTVYKISLELEKRRYQSIEAISKKEKIDLEKIVWLLLTAGGIMPPKTGGKYWRKKGYKAVLEM
ncbi:MAG: hypothetical protein HYT68_01035 [Candidatus Zambryskibacteria bacterium]|nr:hypothetical protein [Candidatus Zambryskibacteria bacterium]